MTAKETLHQLVDDLSEAEAATELKRWTARRSRTSRMTGDDDGVPAGAYEDPAGAQTMSADELAKLL